MREYEFSYSISGYGHHTVVASSEEEATEIFNNSSDAIKSSHTDKPLEIEIDDVQEGNIV